MLSQRYRIDARGQRLTNLLDVTKRLPDVSVTTAEFLDVTRVESDGTVKVVPTPADPTQLPGRCGSKPVELVMRRL